MDMFLILSGVGVVIFSFLAGIAVLFWGLSKLKD